MDKREENENLTATFCRMNSTATFTKLENSRDVELLVMDHFATTLCHDDGTEVQKISEQYVK